MEAGLVSLEDSGVMTAVRELGIVTTYWEEAVLAFRWGEAGEAGSGWWAGGERKGCNIVS